MDWCSDSTYYIVGNNQWVNAMPELFFGNLEIDLSMLDDTVIFLMLLVN